MEENKELDKFRFLVVLYSQLYSSVELMDLARSKPFIKGATKRKVGMALESLERDIMPFVNRLYQDEEEMIFQNLQEALFQMVVDIVDNKIENIVNDYRERKEN